MHGPLAVGEPQQRCGTFDHVVLTALDLAALTSVAASVSADLNFGVKTRVKKRARIKSQGAANIQYGCFGIRHHRDTSIHW